MDKTELEKERFQGLHKLASAAKDNDTSPMDEYLKYCQNDVLQGKVPWVQTAVDHNR